MSRKTLETVVDQFLASYESESTKQSYRNALTRYFTAGELTDLGGVKDIQAEEFPVVMRKLDCSKATVKHTATVVRRFYRFLKAEDRSVVDPTQGYESPPIGDNVPAWNVLAEGDTQLVLKQITEPHGRAVFLALVLQGWRVSELCALIWRDVQKTVKGNWIAKWRGKRDKFRVQGIQAQVIEAALKLQPSRPALAPFIPRPDGQAYTRHEVYGLITRYAKAAGKEVTPHGLRATYISSVIARKGIEAAKQLAGHESLTTTERYSRWAITADDPLTTDDL